MNIEGRLLKGDKRACARLITMLENNDKEAVKVYATLGEICGVLREVFGEYEQSVIL